VTQTRSLQCAKQCIQILRTSNRWNGLQSADDNPRCRHLQDRLRTSSWECDRSLFRYEAAHQHYLRGFYLQIWVKRKLRRSIPAGCQQLRSGRSGSRGENSSCCRLCVHQQRPISESVNITRAYDQHQRQGSGTDIEKRPHEIATRLLLLQGTEDQGKKAPRFPYVRPHSYP
jgi:hypothetical protein